MNHIKLLGIIICSLGLSGPGLLASETNRIKSDPGLKPHVLASTNALHRTTTENTNKKISSPGPLAVPAEVKKQEDKEKEGMESSIRISGLYRGRVIAKANPKMSEGSQTWRLDESPYNEFYLDFDFMYLEFVSGKFTLAATTDQDNKTDTYQSKWKNWTFSFWQGWLKLDLRYFTFSAFHNSDIMEWRNHLGLLNGMKLMNEYREIYNPFENYYTRTVDQSEPFGHGTQGLLCSLQYQGLRNTFHFADDNTTSEDSYALKRAETFAGEGGNIYYWLDKDGDSILDINENDIVHHNFLWDRLSWENDHFGLGLSFLEETVYKWERNAVMRDLWNENQLNNVQDLNGDGKVDNDDLLMANSLLTMGSNVYRAAERYAKNDSFVFDLSYSFSAKIKVGASFGLNIIRQSYVSVPKPTHISLYDTRYPLYTVNRKIDVSIPFFNNENTGMATGLKLELKPDIFILKSLDIGWRVRNGLFEFNLFQHPNISVIDPAYFIPKPVSENILYAGACLFWSDLTLSPLVIYDQSKNKVLEDFTGTYGYLNDLRTLVVHLLLEYRFRFIVPFMEAQFIQYRNVPQVNPQLYKDVIVQVREAVPAIDGMASVGVKIQPLKEIHFKLAYYYDQVSKKAEDVEDFQQILCELEAGF